MYQEALDLIKNSKRALQFLHISPDDDSVGSNLAFKKVVESATGCKVDIVAEDTVKEELGYLPELSQIKKQDLAKIDYAQYDLFILLDISDLARLSKNPHVKLPDGAKILNIDHHKTNTEFGTVNIIEPNVGSTSQLLWRVFKEWGIVLDEDLSTLLLLGIVGDTGTFQYSSAVSPETFKCAADLLEKGADYKDITFNLHQNIPLETFKLWSFVFENIQKAEVNGIKYIWSGIGFDDHQRLKASSYETPAGRFFASIKDTDFGFILVEEDKGFIKCSLRARTNVDVSKIAQEFGGGGHKNAAGFRYETGDAGYEQGVQAILERVKKVLQEK